MFSNIKYCVVCSYTSDERKRASMLDSPNLALCDSKLDAWFRTFSKLVVMRQVEQNTYLECWNRRR